MDEGVTTQSMYKGKVVVKFYGPTADKPNRHMYYVNGKRKTGVTTYIGIKDKSTPLMIWATETYRDALLEVLPKKITKEQVMKFCTLHREKKKEAADIGTEIHEWCEQFILHKLGQRDMPEMPEGKAIQIGAMAFMDWTEAHKVEFKSTERVVYSKKHDFIGTMDIEAKVDGKLCLVDLKSSNGLYNSVNMQTAAYAKADEEERGKAFYKGRWAVRVAKETEEEYHERMARKMKKEYPEYQVFEAKYLDTDIDDDYKAFLACKTLHEWNKRTDYYLNRPK